MVMTSIFLVMPAYMKTFAETLWPMTKRHPGVIQLIQTLDMNSVIFLFVVVSFLFLSLIYSECSLFFPNVLQYGVRFKLKNSLRKSYMFFTYVSVTCQSKNFTYAKAATEEQSIRASASHVENCVFESQPRQT